jgi:cell wall assembly regulator SMI1
MADPHDVAASWSRIKSWLRSNWPEALAELRPGASEEEIGATERHLGLMLPEEMKQFYRIHNGAGVSLFPSSDPGDPMPFTALPLEEVRADWTNWKRLVDIGEFADRSAEAAPGVRADWWNCGWIPLASNGGGDYQCLDLAPAPTGTTGQVISMWHENGQRQLLAPSLSEYLRLIADGLESGKYIRDKMYDLVASRQ